MSGNVFYAQSGGVTAVINASACGVIQAARAAHPKIGHVYAGRNGILGALHDDLIDTTQESDAAIAALLHTPGGAFGSCRYKLKSLEEHRAEYEQLIKTFAKHNIRYFFYNGGGDSQDTTHKVSLMSQQLGYPLTCIGIPKTVDNDLPFTDSSPGFGSVAKYVAVSIREAGFDVASMSATSTKVFIMEVMGRHTGWIAAASGLAAEQASDAPHIILLPEIPFDPDQFLKKVKACVTDYGYCAIVVSEGVRDQSGKFLAEAGLKDAFGHAQLGGVAPVISQLIKERLSYKCHWAVSDYLQRSARHIASQNDVTQAYELGKKAVEYALAGQNGVMVFINRLTDTPYSWKIDTVPLESVANQEKYLSPEFIRDDGFHITPAFRTYLTPLIQGEAYPPYVNGLPHYVRLKNERVAEKIETI